MYFHDPEAYRCRYEPVAVGRANARGKYLVCTALQLQMSRLYRRLQQAFGNQPLGVGDGLADRLHHKG
jgi:hypothetical protein